MNNEQSMPGKATREHEELRRNSDEQQKLLHCIHPFKLFLLIFIHHSLTTVSRQV